MLALLPLAIGVPLGLIAGRTAFRAFADSISTVDDAAVPIAACLAGAAIGLVLANVIGALTARRVRHLALATELRPE